MVSGPTLTFLKAKISAEGLLDLFIMASGPNLTFPGTAPRVEQFRHRQKNSGVRKKENQVLVSAGGIHSPGAVIFEL